MGHYQLGLKRGTGRGRSGFVGDYIEADIFKGIKLIKYTYLSILSTRKTYGRQ